MRQDIALGVCVLEKMANCKVDWFVVILILSELYPNDRLIGNNDQRIKITKIVKVDGIPEKVTAPKRVLSN